MRPRIQPTRRAHHTDPLTSRDWRMAPIRTFEEVAEIYAARHGERISVRNVQYYESVALNKIAEALIEDPDPRTMALVREVFDR